MVPLTFDFHINVKYGLAFILQPFFDFELIGFCFLCLILMSGELCETATNDNLVKSSFIAMSNENKQFLVRL